MPASQARRIAWVGAMVDALDIAEIAAAGNRPLDEVIDVHASIGERLSFALAMLSVGFKELRRLD